MERPARAFEPITTRRLAIRELRVSDRDAFFAYRSTPEVYKYQRFKPAEQEEADEFIGSLAAHPDIPNTWFQLAVCLRADGRLIGDIGIHFLDDAQVEIGCTIAAEFQRQGYGTESLKAVLDYLFSNLNKHRIVASVDPENSKSIGLLERLGMRKEAHFVSSLRVGGLWRDDCVYAMLGDEWVER